jgi:DNA-binding GntR family transcriptional regulator
MSSLQQVLRRFRNSGTTADAVYSTLRHCIVLGDLAPGARLLSDGLATSLGVSRTPVREALRKLEAEGLVEASPRLGLVVREISETDLSEIFAVREALEAAAARLAAENGTSVEVANIRELLEDMDAASQRGELELFRDLTAEFHLSVCRASHNGRLFRMLKDLQDQVRHLKTSTLFIEGRALEALQEHRDLLAALEARDPERAEAIARAHRRKTLELRRKMLRNQTRRRPLDASHEERE